MDSKKYAVVYFPPQEKTLPPITNVAGVSLIERALLTGQRSGISFFYLGGEKAEARSHIEKLLQRHPCLQGHWAWLSPESPIYKERPSLLCYPYDSLFSVDVLNEFSDPENLNKVASQKEEAFFLAHLSWDKFSSAWEKGDLVEMVFSLPSSPQGGFFTKVDSPVKKAEQKLLQSLQSPLEGTVDVYFNRPLGRLMTIPFARWRFHPNLISLFSIAIGLMTAFLFLWGNYYQRIVGAFLLQASAMIDCIDGDVARLLFKESRLGYWLDVAGDNVVHIAVFTCLAIHEYQTHPGWLPVTFGILLVGATILSFGLVMYTQIKLKPAAEKVHLGKSISSLSNFIEKMTSRDFTVLIIFLALIDKLEWFLIVAAIGSQIFWILLSFMIFSIKKQIRSSQTK